MKKKIISLLLCVVMLAGCLMSTGCSIASDDTTSTDTSGADGAVVEVGRTSMTLSLWVPVENATEDALRMVEQAINEKTQAEFDTAIKLYGIPTAEYDELMKERIKFLEDRVIKELEEENNRRQEQIQAAQKGETLADVTTEYVNPNMDGDYSLVVPGATDYVPLDKNQLDIFLIRGYDDYKYYVENGFALSLNEELNASSKILKNYIYPDFFTAVTVDESIYAVPNNHPVGEYTYFLVNKDIMGEEALSAEDYATIAQCFQGSETGSSLIDDIAEYYPDYVPVYGDYAAANWAFWNADGNVDEFSVLASRIDAGAKIENLTFTNVLAERNFINYYERYKELKEKGYLDTSETVPEKFGVGFITCTADEIKQYEDQYHINVYKQPVGTVDDYTDSMFAVSSRTESLPRSMEIITYLNTDPAIRTILQYGVEGKHWKVNEENTDVITQLDITKESADITYEMDLFETGNVYMTYPAYGVSMDEWQNGKDQNSASFMPANYYFISTKNEDGTGLVYINEHTAPLFEELKTLSEEIYAKMEAMTLEEFRQQYSSLVTEINNSAAYKKLTWQPTAGEIESGSKEAEGYYLDGSLWYQWQQRCVEIYGEEFLTW